MNYIFSILFILFSIYFGLLDIRKRGLELKQGIKIFLMYLYFGLSMSLFAFFVHTNSSISIIIFLHLIIISCILMIIHKKNFFISIDLLIISIIGIILVLLDYLNIKIHIFWFIILGLGIYFLPATAYIDKKIDIIKKINMCTMEVNATIIKVYKSRYRHRIIYIPKFEFYVNKKKYDYMNSSEIFSYNPLNIGETVKLFINPNIVLNKNNISENVFLPNSYYFRQLSTIKLFYIIANITLLFLLFLKFFG